MEFVIKLVKKFKEMQSRIIDLENEVLKLNHTFNADENQSLISKRTKGQRDNYMSSSKLSQIMLFTGGP